MNHCLFRDLNSFKFLSGEAGLQYKSRDAIKILDVKWLKTMITCANNSLTDPGEI